MSQPKDFRLMLDNIRSVHNVGSIFRTAETVGVTKMYCIGTTPVPVDRFGLKRKDLTKVSLGAEDMVAWEYSVNGIALIKRLKKEGFIVVALEQAENSIDYRKVKKQIKILNKDQINRMTKSNEKIFDLKNNKSNAEKILLILGNEVGGVSKSLLKLSDVIAEIPMKGKKESLNVSVSAGIMMFELF
jgi:tRNA G18 (ribose-2'-O)-methylase SpoU